jgi:hypothetical protein
MGYSMSEVEITERKAMNDQYLAAAQAKEQKLSIHPTINKFLKDGFQLKFWDDRYSAGIRVAMGREYSQEFTEVCELTDSGDIEAAGLSEYLNNSGAWLPFDCGLTIQEALDLLEVKLSQLPKEHIARCSEWAECYDLALKLIIESADGNYGIANAIDSGKLPCDPFQK